MTGNNPIERIQVVLEAVTKKFSQGFDRARVKLQQFQKQAKSFGNVMGQPMEQFQKFTESGKNASMQGARLATSFRSLTHGMKGFRMEALGVMFFGMMLANAFKQLLNPVMEAYGVFELFRETLVLLFLPIMDLIFPVLLSLMEWFMNMPDSVKTVIGIIVLLMIGIGTFLYIIGSLVLGLGSLILFWPIIGAFFSAIGGFIMPVIAIIMGLVDIFLYWGKSAKKVVRGILTVLAGVAGIVAVIMGAPVLLVAAIVAAVVAIIYLVIKYWDDIVAFFKKGYEFLNGLTMKFWNWIIGIFKTRWAEMKKMTGAAWNWIWSKIGTFVMRIINFFRGLWKKTKEIFNSIWNWIKGVFGGLAKSMVTWGKNLISGMANGIKSAWKAVKNAILSLFPSWARNLIWSAGKFVISIFSKNKNSDSGGSGGADQNDFIWRSGQGAQSINPNDTLVGFKGAVPDVLGGGGGINFNPVYNINVQDKYELQKALDDNNKKMVDDLRRLIKQ